MRPRRVPVILAFVLLAGCSSVVSGTGHASLVPTPTPTAPSSSVPPSSPSGPASTPPVSSPPVSSPPISVPVTSGPPAPAIPFPRATVSTAIGDPPTADLCAAIDLSALEGFGYTPEYNDVIVPPGCSVHMKQHGENQFSVGVYGSPANTQANGKHTVRHESGLRVNVYPYQPDAAGNCPREIRAPGVTLTIYAFNTFGSGDKAGHCGAADAIVHSLTSAIAAGPVPHLALADPSLAAVDFCAALRATRIRTLPGFGGTAAPDGVSNGCVISRSGFSFYVDYEIAVAKTPEGETPKFVAGHQVYESTGNSRTYCSSDSVQGQTSDGKYERISVSANSYGKHATPHLCASTSTALAELLDALRLR